MATHTEQSAFVIDDSKSARLMLSRMLSKSGFSVSEFESGDDFLSLRSEINPPSLIFMDHMMPGTDGLSTTKSLKKDGKFKDVPIIMYTSHDDHDYLNDVKKAGATAILHKPAKQAELTEILSNSELLPIPDISPSHVTSPSHVSSTRKRGSSDALLVDTIKKLKALQVQVDHLANENKQLRDALNAELNTKDMHQQDTGGHGTHVTQDALTAAIRQLTKQFDEKLQMQTQRVSSQLSNITLSDQVHRELEHSLMIMAQRTAEKSSERIATNQAQAVSAKVAAAQSNVITQDAMKSISTTLRTPKLLAIICIVLTLFSIALHFAG